MPPPIPGAAIGEPEAARFLAQATFGPKLEEIRALSTQVSFDPWFESQRTATVSLQMPYLRAKPGAYKDDRMEGWWRFAVTGQDQLRQRVAFALSEIFVVGDEFAEFNQDFDYVAAYYDVLLRNAFGNYRTLIEDVTKSEAMGRFLSMHQNQKENMAEGVRPDENYAREIMQLFSVGLIQLEIDGRPSLTISGQVIPTYTQVDTENLARLFTGWSNGPRTSNDLEFFFHGSAAPPDQPMVAWDAYHDFGPKTLLGGESVSANLSPEADLDRAMDTLFNHPNVGPFIGRQLIQRLVTSNPTPEYVARVASVFNNNGSGVRGDLWAVVRAILLDTEARRGHLIYPDRMGKLREPILRVTNLWRSFGAVGKSQGYWYPFPSDDLGQGPLRSPSVFNFFRPSYQQIGPLTNAGLVAPEFQITNESSITVLGNTLDSMAGFFRANSGGTSGFNFYPEIFVDYRPWETRAANPSGLVDDLNLVLMSGQMPAAMRQTLVNHVSAMPASPAAERVSEAVTLILMSPQYAVQR